MSGFSTARLRMVDSQLRTSDVTDRRLLDAMLTVPREVFVPASRRAMAYLDLDLDVAEAGSTKRFLIKPALTGKLMQAAQIGQADRVLVVGCATGYMAAVAAMLAAHVTATEADSALAAKAKETLSGLDISNVACKCAACPEGDPEGSPYDVILLNGATEVRPEGLFAQLKEGGRLVGLFALGQLQRAMIVTRSHGEFGHRALFDAAAPVLPGLARTPSFVF